MKMHTYQYYILSFSLQGLKNVTVIEGESVTLECHISGYPSPKVTWYREDYQIESSIDFQITFQSGIARLMIREAFAEDSGRFTCSAVNEAGTVSTSCYLAVQGEWPYSHVLAHMLSLTHHSQRTLPCTVGSLHTAQWCPLLERAWRGVGYGINLNCYAKQGSPTKWTKCLTLMRNFYLFPVSEEFEKETTTVTEKFTTEEKR